jgi:hypothetical protein
MKAIHTLPNKVLEKLIREDTHPERVEHAKRELDVRQAVGEQLKQVVGEGGEASYQQGDARADANDY